MLYKHPNGLGFAIFEELEIFMLQTRDGITLTIGDDYIDQNFTNFCFDSGHRRGIVLRNLRLGKFCERRAQ